MNRTVNLTNEFNSRGLRYCPVVLAATDGAGRSGIINSQEERHRKGLLLEWWRGEAVRLSVGKDSADASARRLQKEAELNAVNTGRRHPERERERAQVDRRRRHRIPDETRLTKSEDVCCVFDCSEIFQESSQKRRN